MPHIKGDAANLEMVHIYNSEHIVVKELEISNKGERIRPRLNGFFVELYNLYTGILIHDGNGFKKYDGSFDKNMWYDANDKNWDKLIDFVKDKKVPLNNKEIPVLEIIGY